MKKDVKKFTIKATALVLSALSMGSFVACGGGNKIEDTETNLIINFYNAGYGEGGYKALEKAFEQYNTVAEEYILFFKSTR